jgi:hypothetical protein
MQLIDDGRLDMLDTMNDRRIDRAYVVEKFGVGPEQLGEVLALMGDSVDNIPGVPGIGPKTAAQLIQQYGDVETLLSRTDEITKPKLKQNLIEHADAARMSRELVKLVCDSPLPQPLGKLEMQGIPDGPLRDFLEHHGFKSLLARLNGQSQVRAPSTDPAKTPVQREVRPEPKIDRSAYETVLDEAALNRWIAEAVSLGRIAIDTETTSRDPIRAELVGISLATECNRACYIPLAHGGDDLLTERADQLAAELVLGKLKPLLEDPAILKIGHNLKFDWILLDRRGIKVAPIDDTLVMSFDLNAGGLSSHALDDLAKEHLDHQCLSFKEVCGSGNKQICFDKVGLQRATEYAAEDADVTLRLWKRFKARLPHERVTQVYETVDRPLVPVLARMEREGSRSIARSCPICRPSSTSRSSNSKPRCSRRPAAPSRSAARSSLAKSCSIGCSSPAGARVSPGSGRPTSMNSSDCRATAFRLLGSCSTGASSPSSRTPIPTRCSSRSIRRRAAFIPITACPERRPGDCHRPTRTSRTSRSGPRSAAVSATRSSQSRAMSCSRPTTARSSFGWPPTWPTCRSSARLSRTAPTSTA